MMFTAGLSQELLSPRIPRVIPVPTAMFHIIRMLGMMTTILYIPCVYTPCLKKMCQLLLWNSCDENDAFLTVCLCNCPAPSEGNTRFYLSKPVAAKQSGWLRNLGTDTGTYVQDTCLWHRWLDTWASISQNVINEAVDQWRKRLHASEKVKRHHFEFLLS